MKKAVVFGSCCMDIITRTDVLPVLGQTVMGIDFHTAIGGKGSNQAYTMAKLGADVTMCGCVGQDDFGKRIKEDLESQGVQVGPLEMVEGVQTGTATIMVVHGDNEIIIAPGANYQVDEAFFEKNKPILKSADLIVMQLELPMETSRMVWQFAKDNQIPVCLNPSPAAPLSDDELASLTYIIANETECAFYTGKPVISIEDAKEGVRLLNQKGIPFAIVTLGKDGAVFNEGTEILHVPSVKVEAVDSTAAGDTFAGAFLTKRLAGASMTEAVTYGTYAGAYACTKLGAHTSTPSKEELDAFIQANPR